MGGARGGEGGGGGEVVGEGGVRAQNSLYEQEFCALQILWLLIFVIQLVVNVSDWRPVQSNCYTVNNNTFFLL